MTMSETDKKFLESAGIKAEPCHCAAIIRILDERERAVRAETALRQNAEVYDKFTDAREMQIATWRQRAWALGFLSGALGLIAVLAIALRP
jgi:hypothetical protein